ncbi:unnamed protein product [Vitrella brassicaformis CCMP3155]|uniref:RING-type domain-containing protein n=3 Tax=Vitrella brassicaformis TaxID=1169539 RepID=A0A0G4FU92_VITBC|nr:unnamed protein product [Vitrella brassicaformis CCMP3155]|eukprot:CEM18267.1 unnamed protein product [Vitrella brassicaformis CCMP3155]
MRAATGPKARARGPSSFSSEIAMEEDLSGDDEADVGRMDLVSVSCLSSQGLQCAFFKGSAESTRTLAARLMSRSISASLVTRSIEDEFADPSAPFAIVHPSLSKTIVVSLLSIAIDDPFAARPDVWRFANGKRLTLSPWPSRAAQSAVLEALIKGGAGVDGHAQEDNRPMKVAVASANKEATNMLLKHKARVHGLELIYPPSSAERLPQPYAASLLKIYRQLLFHDRSLATERDEAGCTALHLLGQARLHDDMVRSAMRQIAEASKNNKMIIYPNNRKAKGRARGAEGEGWTVRSVARRCIAGVKGFLWSAFFSCLLALAILIPIVYCVIRVPLCVVWSVVTLPFSSARHQIAEDVAECVGGVSFIVGNTWRVLAGQGVEVPQDIFEHVSGDTDDDAGDSWFIDKYIDLLVEHGLSLMNENDSRDTPLDFAAPAGSRAVVEHLCRSLTQKDINRVHPRYRVTALGGAAIRLRQLTYESKKHPASREHISDLQHVTRTLLQHGASPSLLPAGNAMQRQAQGLVMDIHREMQQGQNVAKSASAQPPSSAAPPSPSPSPSPVPPPAPAPAPPPPPQQTTTRSATTKGGRKGGAQATTTSSSSSTDETQEERVRRLTEEVRALRMQEELLREEARERAVRESKESRSKKGGGKKGKAGGHGSGDGRAPGASHTTPTAAEPSTAKADSNSSCVDVEGRADEDSSPAAATPGADDGGYGSEDFAPFVTVTHTSKKKKNKADKLAAANGACASRAAGAAKPHNHRSPPPLVPTHKIAGSLASLSTGDIGKALPTASVSSATAAGDCTGETPRGHSTSGTAAPSSANPTATGIESRSPAEDSKDRLVHQLQQQLDDARRKLAKATADQQPSTERHPDTDCIICDGDHGKATIMIIPCRHMCVCTHCYTQWKARHQQEVAAARQRQAAGSTAALPRFECPCCRADVVFAGTREEVLKWANQPYKWQLD